MSMTAHIDRLRERHAAVDGQLGELAQHPSADDTEITKLKREKLRLKDEIERLSTRLN